jgi:hypothetical protein
MRLHDWGEPDKDRVRTCRREGCGVQRVPSVPPFRAFGWRRGPEDRWHVGMGALRERVGKDEPGTQG